MPVHADAGFDPVLRSDLSDRLRQVGTRIHACERMLFEHGFRGGEIHDDMYRALAEGPADLEAFDRFRASRAATVLSVPDGRLFLDYSGLPPNMRAFEGADFSTRSRAIDAMHPRFREAFREEARRFAGELDDTMSFDSIEHRIHAIKYGATRIGLDVSKAQRLAELRPVFGCQVAPRLSLVAACSWPTGVYSNVTMALLDLDVGLLDSEIAHALKRRLTSRAMHVPVDIENAIPALRFYKCCESLAEIAAGTAATCLVIRWLADQLSASGSAG
jgi:hypothetical protein